MCHALAREALQNVVTQLRVSSAAPESSLQMVEACIVVCVDLGTLLLHVVLAPVINKAIHAQEQNMYSTKYM